MHLPTSTPWSTPALLTWYFPRLPLQLLIPRSPTDPLAFMASYLNAKAAAARVEAGVDEQIDALTEELGMFALFTTPRVSAAGDARVSSGSMIRPDTATPRATAVAALVQGAVERILARPSNSVATAPTESAPEHAVADDSVQLE